MVYFAKLPTGAIKIGCTGDVDARLVQLGWYFKQPLALLHTMEGNRQTERAIHRRFAHLRLNGAGEQFRPAADLMEFIGWPLLVSANPDVQEVKIGKPVRIDPDLASKAQIVALRRRIPLSDHLSDVIRARVLRDFAKVMSEAGEGEGASGGGKW